MEPDENLLMYGIILFVLIMAKAFFTISEISIITLNDAKIKKMAQSGNSKAMVLVKILNHPSKFLETIQVGITLSVHLAAATAAICFTSIFAELLDFLPFSKKIIYLVSLFIITLTLTFLTLILGGHVPKRLGMTYCEKIALVVAKPISRIITITKPSVWLISIVTNGILRLIGIDPNIQPEQVTEEEIRMLIGVGEENGNIPEDEKNMINNIFEFDDRTAVELMTHRTEMMALHVDATLEEIVNTALSSGYSRIPVYDDDLDETLGILYVKDLLGLILKSPEEAFDLRSYLREPFYVLESSSGKNLLEDFQNKKLQMAVVVDEYGGTSGFVTMEDLMESIVGNIQDEYDNEIDDISIISDNLYEISGLTDLDDVAKFFDIEIENDENDDLETISGYIVHRLGYIPEDNEHPSTIVADIQFTVFKMDERRIDKLHACVLHSESLK